MATMLQTYVQKGQKLSFRDMISNIYPVDTPIFSAAKNEKASGKNHQFQEEQLDTPGQNASVEGAVTADEEQIATRELNSWTQIFEKKAKVSDTGEAIGKYGRKKELARQEMLKGKSIMNDIEYAYSHSQQGSAATASTRRAMKSLIYQLRDESGNLQNVFDCSGNAMTEANMLNVHEQVYNDGGNPDMFVIPSADGTTVAAWATTADAAIADTAARIRDFGTGKELVHCVELLETPYGRMRVVLSRYQQADGYDASADLSGNSGGTALNTLDDGLALLVDTSLICNAELRTLRRKKLATTGSFESTLVDWEGTLAVLNSQGCGALYKVG